jgi:hypothetical protein
MSKLAQQARSFGLEYVSGRVHGDEQSSVSTGDLLRDLTDCLAFIFPCTVRYSSIVSHFQQMSVTLSLFC